MSDSTRPAATIHPAFGVTGAAIATILMALGLDMGWTTHRLLRMVGIPDTLTIRAVLIGTGVALFIVFGILLPQLGFVAEYPDE